MPRRLLAHMSNHPQPEQNPRLTRAHFLPSSCLHSSPLPTTLVPQTPKDNKPGRKFRTLAPTQEVCPMPGVWCHTDRDPVPQPPLEQSQLPPTRGDGCFRQVPTRSKYTLSSLSPSASLSPSKPKCHLTFYSDNRAFQCVSATYAQKSLWTQRRIKEPGKISINKIPQWSSPELKRGYHI